MRLAGHSAAIDRNSPLGFSFDGRQLRGYEGDTIASALIANDIRIVARSFKYHRPRGIFSAGPEEPNALVELGSGAARTPNIKATTARLLGGETVASQNRFPSLGFDLGAVNGLLSPFLGAGFYYKTFMWPRGFWEKVYEPVIRRAAGLGRASGLPDPDRYEKVHAFCDLLVIGGGPAGIAAALAAANAGKQVLLCERDFRLGGRAWASQAAPVPGQSTDDWVAEMEARVHAHPNIELLRNTTIFGIYDGGIFGAAETVDRTASDAPRERLWRIAASASILATGAIERPLLFPGNDLPGVLLAGAAAIYARRFGVAVGRRMAFYVNNDSGWRAAQQCANAGVEIAAVIDARAAHSPTSAEIAATLGADVHFAPREVRAKGRKSVRAIEIETREGRKLRIGAEGLGVAGGWNPDIALCSHLGARPRWDAERGQFLAAETPPAMIVCGGAAGIEDGAAALLHGDAAARAYVAGKPLENLSSAAAPAPLPALRRGRRGKVFVDLQHDVTDRDVEIAWREGYRSVEHLKRYTTLGMATDQGRTSNFTGLALMAELCGQTIAETGVTTARPPATPVAIGLLAGEHRDRSFRPLRRTATDRWAEANGAAFIEAGLWRRAQWYARPGETNWLTTVSREAAGVRKSVGICDVSTLGKIDIQGPDAAAFLDFVYAGLFSTLAVGKARYGLMLREDGFVFDDGTTARLGDQHFIMSTTTANAEAVMEHLEFCAQVLRPELDVQFMSATEQWAQFAVAGPRSRDLVRAVIEAAFDVSDEAFPHMAAAETRLVTGTAARLFRMSFSGERAYEIAVPAAAGEALWHLLLRLGEPLGVTPYGTEALGVLRIEKGHVAGAELDGRTTAHDLGMGRMLSKKKDFIGRVMAGRPALTADERPALVGVRPVDPAARIYPGAHLLPLGELASFENDQGHLSSAAWSPEAGQWIALGFLQNGRARIGERLLAFDPVRDATTEVEICSPIFVDPTGDRARG